MTDRRKRLAKILSVQQQLKAYHEARHAGFLAEAASAEQEAVELGRRFDAPESMSALFPEVYHRRIGKAIGRRDENTAHARAEASRVATATARTNMVERAYRDVMRQEERHTQDKATLEAVERSGNNDK